jgi:hypothetical protein
VPRIGQPARLHGPSGTRVSSCAASLIAVLTTSFVAATSATALAAPPPAPPPGEPPADVAPTVSQPTASTPPVTPDADPSTTPPPAVLADPPPAKPDTVAEPAKPTPAPAPAKDPSDKSDQPVDKPPPTPAGPKDPNQPPGYADGFHFGSYGRVIAGGDAAGRAGRNADIVARGSRLDESNYAELELRREDYWKKTGAYTRIVATTAFANPVFHYNGQFAATIALRNLYIEETGLGAKGLSIWAGSRMYRGDDIYLLDFWPLDNLNTIGGGAGYAFGSSRRTTLKFHAGLNQPTDPYYRQTILRAPAHNQFGEQEVAILDRQKLVSSLKLTHTWPVSATGGVKGILYGELHYVPGGQREVEAKTYEDVPKDHGFVAGGQLTAFTGKRSTYLTVTGSFAHGLAAYGELNAPRQLRPDRKASGRLRVAADPERQLGEGPLRHHARQLLPSVPQRLEAARLRRPQRGHRDRPPDLLVRRDRRPLARGLVPGPAARRARGGRPRLLQARDGHPRPRRHRPLHHPRRPRRLPAPAHPPHLPAHRPRRRRPLALRPDDVFARRKVDHFIGIGAEWWFGSTSYFRD